MAKVDQDHFLCYYTFSVGLTIQKLKQSEKFNRLDEKFKKLRCHLILGLLGLMYSTLTNVL